MNAESYIGLGQVRCGGCSNERACDFPRSDRVRRVNARTASALAAVGPLLYAFACATSECQCDPTSLPSTGVTAEAAIVARCAASTAAINQRHYGPTTVCRPGSHPSETGRHARADQTQGRVARLSRRSVIDRPQQCLPVRMTVAEARPRCRGFKLADDPTIDTGWQRLAIRDQDRTTQLESNSLIDSDSSC